jgi:nicotinamide-nucleotide amidase
MKVEILTIGNELLLGFTVDSNSAFLSRELAAIGVEVVRHTSVADAPEVIAAEVNAALDRSGAVITSGGLGPTSDDMSVAAVATALGLELEENVAVLRWIERLLASRGYKLPISAANRKQALLPLGARPLMNKRGTAPGIWIDIPGRGWVAMLPGVPGELRGLYNDEIAPTLISRRKGELVVLSNTVRTTGVAEATLAEVVQNSGQQFPELAYLPGIQGVDLRLSVHGFSGADAGLVLSKRAADLRAILGDSVYGENDDDLAAIVLALARDSSMKIAVAESCTGGLLGARLTAVPGASSVFAGGVIAYANSVKESHLGVTPHMLEQHGAVSEAAVLAMCTGVRQRFGTEIAVSVSGVAGPGGGTAQKPVGTVWVATNVGDSVRSARRVLPGTRTEIRERAAQMALDLLRKELLRT